MRGTSITLFASACVCSLLGCAPLASRQAPPRDPLPILGPKEAAWLGRVEFGADSAAIREYARLGRERFLDEQLHPRPFALPESLVPPGTSHEELGKVLDAIGLEYKRIQALPEGPERVAARKSLNERGNAFAYQSIRRELLLAVYSPAQLQEQMVWFWINHFSVYQGKGQLRWLTGDYAEHAVRPHALGKFRDLVLATLQHPAMVEYLDNRQNAVGHVNENYARELMELHTLGVDGGYTQADVQQLARILTGVGFNVRRGSVGFNPARHDFGPKVLLGQAIKDHGFAEVERAVTLIVREPACAHFVATKIATYFVADVPPPALVERMARTFQHSDGDIAAVLRTMFLSTEFNASLGRKFRDPMRFVIAAVRFAYDGRLISNTRPMLNWLNGLGEAPFGRQTPDGYPLTEAGWASSGQMSRRFEIARAIGAGSAGLFDGEDGTAGGSGGFPQLSGRLYFAAVEPFLAASTRAALSRATSQAEWNTLLLASPDFNYE